MGRILLKAWNSGNSNGADDGSRTRLYSLGSCRSTDELHPQGGAFGAQVDSLASKRPRRDMLPER